MRIELDIVTKAPTGLHDKDEISLDQLAKMLGLPEAETTELLKGIDEIDKNLTVGDVHVATSLKDISVAYEQGEEDDGEQEEDEDDEDEASEAARKASGAEIDLEAIPLDKGDEDQERDDHGRFAEGSGGGAGSKTVADHVSALTNAGTDRSAFEAALGAIRGDKSLTNNDLKRIASRYLGGHVHGSKATRSDVINGLERKFTEHARFENKLKSDAGVVFSMTVTKAVPDQRKIFGYASVASFDGDPVIDKQDDIIPIEELEKAAHEFTLFSRTHGDMHTDIGVGRLIESIVFDKDKRDAGIVAKDEKGRVIDGWFVGFQVDDDAVWEAHKAGARLEFSIGGRAQREPA